MTPPRSPSPPEGVSGGRSPWAFFVLVVALSVPLWVLGSVVEVAGLPKNMQVTEPVLAFTPAAAASILVYRADGRAGLRRLWARAFDAGRITRRAWYLPLLLLMPVLSALSLAGAQLLGIELPVQPPIPLLVLPLLVVAFAVAVAGEELGYMGYAIDPLQHRWGALGASLVIGVFWGLWHVPALLQNDQSTGYIAVGLLAAVGVRVLIVWVYNNTGRSVFAAILLHVTANLASTYVATSAGGPLAVGVAVLVAVIWGPRTLTGYRP